MKLALLRAVVCLGLVLCSASAYGHTATFSVLVLRERAPGEFMTSWEQTPTVRDPSAAYDLLRPVFPEHCRFTPPRLECGASGLSGAVGLDGLGELGTAGVIKIQWRTGKTQVLSLTSTAPHVRVSAEAQRGTTLASVMSFVGLGVLHIGLGWDHLLFVLGLSWFAESWRALLKTITAFTVAHSVTLVGASLGLFMLPQEPVEAVIALSIAFLAVEMVREARGGAPSVTRRRPWLAAFLFGLLHGFGFASALSELALSRQALPLALLCFNLGVELGQVLFVAALVCLRPAWRQVRRALGPGVEVAGKYAIGTTAMFWFFDRVSAFWPSS
ncbi:MAG: HupE/UreJ family protein [Myxococcales bacterium]|nr:MAG: HupE/UreJ family protein [Myxococcales bacterium]